ncbi:hypothetical protein GE21DRAFT_8538 [Neurospora crassa]|uniref:Uncharacterized protein n=2 Tax=Neurospora crassa TaxID=5141 RepID=Q1K5Y3_NEUCR|nr:hypothetical protein NCU07150 [Neurospora crassa OR74A]EAA28139.1 hypothetical protein NCU07150 [Neurospora crassa OR74A]KHE85826.1 hypothetical protein GE21DRAFT_8538 [Neurospora crassa]CAD71113.1 hypothetical protein [Neurospora crassa]|eukprot:XP_957375.1 hypothetical protein NCU07150 [Neurospora crassa OR74A]
MSDKPSDQTPNQRGRSSRSRSPPAGPAPVRDRRDHQWKRNTGGAQKAFSNLDQQRIRRLLEAQQSTQGVGRGREPDFLERLNQDPSSPHCFNWMARQDSFLKPNAYLAKTTTDRESLLALVNQIEKLAMEHNTPVANVRIELVPQFFVEQHRNEVGGTIHDQEEPIAIDYDDQPAAEVAKAPSVSVPDVVCGNKKCGRKGHTVAQCIIPDPQTGLVYGCPLCNTDDHLVDWNCPVKPKFAPGTQLDPKVIQEYIERLLDVCFVKRANRPFFATNGMTWPGLFQTYRHYAEHINTFEELNKSSWDTRGHYPWTPEYAMRMVDSVEKMDEMKKFDPTTHTCRNVGCSHSHSRDPVYNKYESLSETIDAYLDGKWDVATGWIPTTNVDRLTRLWYLEAQARRLVKSVEFLVKEEPGAEAPPAPVKPESFPPPTIVSNTSNLVQYVWNEETQNFVPSTDWSFLSFVTTQDKAPNLLRRCDPEADYAIEYAAWVFKHQRPDNGPVGDSLEDQALRAVIKAEGELRNRESRVAKLGRQAQKRRNAREAEDREMAFEAQNSASTIDVHVKREHD